METQLHPQYEHWNKVIPIFQELEDSNEDEVDKFWSDLKSYNDEIYNTVVQLWGEFQLAKASAAIFKTMDISHISFVDEENPANSYQMDVNTYLREVYIGE